MKSITIKNLKRIKNLEFELPDSFGVYLLVGENGSGKTTLLNCIDRICNARAFATEFTVSTRMRSMDQYPNASIEYNVDNTCVRFRRGPQKWSPTPKKGSRELLNQFGYTDSIFVKADSKRISATQEEIASGRTENVNYEIKSALNMIFQTSKYSQLKRLKISKGRGKPPVYLYTVQDGNTHFTEKRFSTGELAIIRLVEKMYSTSENMLLLLDEAEMALHPKIQRNLYEYLKATAIEKHLTVIISTHSTTLIKLASKDQIMLLEEVQDGNMTVTCPCYPAKALGGIDSIENSGYDVIFFVEDDMAKLYLDFIIRRLRGEESQYATISYCIFPTGGFYETARIAVDTKNRLLSGISVYAVLDADAFEKLEEKPKFSTLLSSNRDDIKNLQITPEVWFCEQIEDATPLLCREVRNKFHRELTSLIQDSDYIACNAQSERKRAKDKFRVLIEKLAASSGMSEELVTREIINIFVNSMALGTIKCVLMPMLRCV